MKAIVSDLSTNLVYLRGVNIIDDELLPPEEIGYPQVGVKDGALTRDPESYGQNTELLEVRVTAYQSVLLSKPGSSITGEISLGNAGKGTLQIGKDIVARLHKNLLGLTGYIRARFVRQEASQTIFSDETARLAQRQTFIFEYLREIAV